MDATGVDNSTLESSVMTVNNFENFDAEEEEVLSFLHPLSGNATGFRSSSNNRHSVIVGSLCNSIEILLNVNNVKHDMQHKILSLIASAYHQNDEIFKLEQAVATATDFSWPKEVFTKDLDTLRRLDPSLKNMELLAEHHHEQWKDDRVSIVRINSIDCSSPKQIVLRDIAARVVGNGISIPTAPDFIPSKKPQKFRQMYLCAENVVNKMFLKLWEQGYVLLLPTTTASSLSPPAHFQTCSWMPSAGAVEGKMSFDPTNSDKGVSCLNTPFLKNHFDDIYSGKTDGMTLPTITDLIEMILRQIMKVGSNPDDSTIDIDKGYTGIVLWIEDLKKAFFRMGIANKSVRLLGINLKGDTEHGDLSAFSVTGSYGLSVYPIIFTSTMSPIKAEINEKIDGEIDIYVDDSMGVSPTDSKPEDRAILCSTMERIWGPRPENLTMARAIAPEKSREGRNINWIGWNINLDTRLITFKEEAYFKTLWAFVSVNENEPLTVKFIAKLASLATRAVFVVRIMAGFTMDLYNQLKGIKNWNSALNTRVIDDSAKFCIRLWRAVLILLRLEGNFLIRSIDSFANVTPSIKIDFDASLTGGGIVAHSLLPGGKSRLLFASRIIFPFDCKKDSSFQNSCEFLVIVIALAFLAQKGYGHITIILEGDSTSALAWAEKQRFRSSLSRTAIIAFLAIDMELEFKISETILIKSEDNIKPDRMSRGDHPSSLGFPPNLTWDYETDDLVDFILQRCDPTSDPPRNEIEVCTFLKEIRQKIKER